MDRQSILEEARREWYIAALIHSTVEGAFSEAAQHLAAAWKLFSRTVAETASGSGDDGDWIEGLADGDLPWSDFPRSRFAQDLRYFEDPNQERSTGGYPSAERLYQHILLLKRALDREEAVSQGSRLKARGWLGATFFIAGSITILLVLFSNIAGRIGPWSVQFYPAASFFGEPLRIASARVVAGENEELSAYYEVDTGVSSVRWFSCMEVKTPMRIIFELTSDDSSAFLIDDELIATSEEYQPRRVFVQLLPGMHSLSVLYTRTRQYSRVLLRARIGSQPYRVDFSQFLRYPAVEPVPGPLPPSFSCRYGKP